jgi:hypothetical protein
MLRKERSIANKILQEDLRAQKSKASKQTLVNSKRVSQVEEKVAFEEQETPAVELSRSNASKESKENTDHIKSELKDVEEDLKVETTTTTSPHLPPPVAPISDVLIGSTGKTANDFFNESTQDHLFFLRFISHLCTMLKLRFLTFYRFPRLLILSMLFPLIFVLAGFLLMSNGSNSQLQILWEKLAPRSSSTGPAPTPQMPAFLYPDFYNVEVPFVLFKEDPAAYGFDGPGEKAA